MKPKWIKVGDSERDLFDILKLLIQGEYIEKIANSDSLISVSEIRKLLLRTTEYLKNHLILDSYLETVNKLVPFDMTKIQPEWTENEIKELQNLYNSGAELENIATLMRKEKTEVREKLQSLKLENERI